MRGGPPQPLDEALAAAGVLERAHEVHGAPAPAPTCPGCGGFSYDNQAGGLCMACAMKASASPEPAPNSPGDVGFLDQEQLAGGVVTPAGGGYQEAPPTVRECSSCHARIYWAQVVDERGQRSGKPMPVDAQPDPVRGNVVLYRNRHSGRAIFARVLRKGEPPPPGTHLRTSHFATCPNAQHHRRNRR